MKYLVVLSAAVALSGCVSSPDKYAASLPTDDPKFKTVECQKIREQSLEFDNQVGSRVAIGLASGLLLGPFGLPIAAAADAQQNDRRKYFAREIHLRCSSKPLPKELQDVQNEKIDAWLKS